MQSSVRLVYLLSLAGFTLCLLENNIEIEINDGKILGSYKYTGNGRKFSAFKGIPYAKAPINELRFLPPQPAEPWKDVKNTTQSGSSCPGLWTTGFIGNEDCLYLNVHTPYLDNFPKQEPLPVLVFIHGGAYIFGSGAMANGHFLLDQDVILVAPNYRLNAFGFLSLNTSQVSGNQGLMDQQLALKWVQENIFYFGGDPTKVTIIGQSAGSWSVLHQMLAPGSRGLFSGAIAQSGAFVGGKTLKPYTAEQDASHGLGLAKILGCSGDTVLECMQSKTMNQIMSVPFLPRGSIDGVMLPGDPQELLENGQFNRVPLIIGNTDKEFILIADILIGLLGVTPTMIQLGWPVIGPMLLTETYAQDVTLNDIAFANEIKNFYIKPFGIFTHNNLEELLDMATDALFQYHVHTTARVISQFVPQVYQYRFSHKGPYQFLGFSKELNAYGVSHADDLFYQFDFTSDQCALFQQIDFDIAHRQSEFFANFAKNRDPNNEEDLDFWKPVTPDSFGYLKIQNGWVMLDNDPVYEERMKFWEEAIKKFYPQ